MAMSIPGLYSGNIPPPLPDRARASQPLPEVPNEPPAGSLVLIDVFNDGYDKAAHGNTAAYAARQQGFRGNLYAQYIGSSNVPQMASTAHDYLNSGPLDAAQTNQAVDGYARYEMRWLLQSVAGDLNQLGERGLHDSAVNVSYGTSPEAVADRLYKDMAGAREPFSPNAQLRDNIQNAYGLDQAKLESSDPRISGPERANLQQHLLDAAERAMHAPDVQQAQQGYDQAVDSLQAHHNSVVVSAGNEQQMIQGLTRDAGGIAPKVAADANHNLLANSAVTTVGATRWMDSRTERIAPYSNLDPNVGIYASGSVGNGVNPQRMNTSGTSFAAPRVAATMATLRGTHPGSSNSATLNLMRSRLTHELGGVPVLDYHRAEEYMRQGTF